MIRAYPARANARFLFLAENVTCVDYSFSTAMRLNNEIHHPSTLPQLQSLGCAWAASVIGCRFTGEQGKVLLNRDHENRQAQERKNKKRTARRTATV